MDDFDEDTNCCVLISPDGYEMVMPLFDRSYSRIASFVGVDTARHYEQARIRTEQPIESVRTRLLQLSNWPKIVTWFAISETQGESASSVSVNWMIGTAQNLVSLGYESEQLVGLDEATSANENNLERG